MASFKIGVSLSLQGTTDREWSLQMIQAMQLRLAQLLQPNATYPVHPALRAPGAVEIIVDDCSMDGGTVHLGSAIASAIRLHKWKYANALIGVGYSDSTIGTASVGSTLGIGVCDGGSTSPALSSKEPSSTFFRTIPNDNVAAEAIVAAVAAQGWKRFVTISSTDFYGNGLLEATRESANTAGLEAMAAISFLPGTTDFTLIVDELIYSGGNVVVFLSLHGDLISFLRELHRRGLIEDGLQVITSDDAVYANRSGISLEDLRLWHGLWAAYPEEGVGAEWASYKKAWELRYNHTDPTVYSGFYSSCIEGFVWGASRKLSNGMPFETLADSNTRWKIPEDLPFATRSGVTGNLAFDPHGDRVVPYRMYYFDAYSGPLGSFKSFAEWKPSPAINYTTEAVTLDNSSFNTTNPALYFSGTWTRPATEIAAVYRTVEWSSALGIFCIILSSLMVLLIGSLATLVYRHRSGEVLKPASPIFLLTILVGVLGTALYPLTLIGEPSTLACGWSLWIMMSTIGLVFGSLIAKMFRVIKIFRFPGKMDPGKIGDIRLVFGLAGCICIYWVIGLVWTAADPLKPVWEEAPQTGRTTEMNVICRSTSVTFGWVMRAISWLYTAVIIVHAVALTWLCRDIPSDYSDSKRVGWLLSLYITTAVLILPPLLALRLETYSFVLFQVVPSYFVGFATLIILFGGRIYRVFHERELGARELFRSNFGIRSKSKKGLSAAMGMEDAVKTATKRGEVFLAEKRLFFTLWTQKTMYCFADKGLLLLIGYPPNPPAIGLKSHALRVSVNIQSDAYALRLINIKEKRYGITIRVLSNEELREWARVLTPLCVPPTRVPRTITESRSNNGLYHSPPATAQSSNDENPTPLLDPFITCIVVQFDIVNLCIFGFRFTYIRSPSSKYLMHILVYEPEPKVVSPFANGWLSLRLLSGATREKKNARLAYQIITRSVEVAEHRRPNTPFVVRLPCIRTKQSVQPRGMTVPDTIGKRIFLNPNCGTVRFHGVLPGSEQRWYGIEWDDATRGKHSGTHNGLQYFTTRDAGSGSFIREGKLTSECFGRSFLDALAEKYQAQQPTDSTVLLGGDGVAVETVGWEKIAKKVSNLKQLREVGLAEMRIGFRGQEGWIGQMCPSIVDLDLSRNLLATWNDVGDICIELPNLASLRLSHNRMKPFEGPTSSLHGAFLPLKALTLFGTLMAWSEIQHLQECMPNLEELHLGENRFKALDVETVSGFQRLSVLNLEHNELSSWKEISKLGSLPALHTLMLNNNNLTTIDVPVGSAFSNLSTLNIVDNKINSWTTVHVLNSFPSLTHVRIRRNPVVETVPAGDMHDILVARLRSLKYVNGSNITPNSRRDAELFYLNQCAKELSESNDPTAFAANHPRYEELSAAYGAPSLVPAAMTSAILKDRVVVVTISCQGRRARKKIPNTMNVRALRALITRMFSLKERGELVRKDKAGRLVTMEDDLRDVDFYGLESGDEVVVDMK
ncbi:uncharacterized protein EV422DRAFT_578604 [Fimicolochytrium jonesii]|uniref:uncharacterized protein n=1 Tax=Fimicolochytrium jonesii TaxID=1396493 RepID=UPI0022FE99D7|nr:uncharacterized protein EV422DRAFT_578604 [Fimicolochytrium jonesii]KAI8820758.1 hypothetical protein EV422DRAFT_578604 [Fimicolochytrium jonesii]